MANTDNPFAKLKSFLDRVFRVFDNFISDYSTKDNEVTSKSGQVTYSFKLEPNAKLGNDKEISVKLTATNVGSSFKQYTQAISNLTYDNLKKDAKLQKIVDKLVGDLSKPQEPPLQYADTDSGSKNKDLRGDISIKEGKGLLGVNLDITSSDQINALMSDANFKPWMDASFSHLLFDFVCEAPECKSGNVTESKLALCPKWLFTYIDYIKETNSVNETTTKSIDELQPIEGEDTSTDTKGQDKAAIKTMALAMVLPILAAIQAELKGMYNDQLAIEDSLDKLVENDSVKPEESSDEESGNEGEEPSEDNSENAEEADDEMEKQLEESGYTGASKKITVKLQKVQGSIDLIGLESNYGPGPTLDDIDDIVSQDEFINALGEGPEAYNILVDEDGYDIEQCDTCEIDPCASLNSVMNTAIVMYRNLYVLHWMAKGNDMMKLHLLTEELYSELIQEIDTLGELLVEKCGTVQNLDFEWTPIAVRNYEFQESLFILKDFIQNYIDTIDYAYPNQTSDVQSTLDEWLRYWNKQMNYFIKNQEEQ